MEGRTDHLYPVLTRLTHVGILTAGEE
jgi:hypothetical protein